MYSHIAPTPGGGNGFLDHAAERELAVRWRKHGDVEAREKLVLSQQPYARKLARIFSRECGLDAEDLFNAAMEGGLIAADKFDPDRGFRFNTCCRWWMEAEVRKICDKPAQGMTPGRSEAQRPNITYLDAELPGADDEIDDRDQHDIVADENAPSENDLNEVVDKDRLRGALLSLDLTFRDRRIIELRLADVPVAEIANEIGISRQRIDQIWSEHSAIATELVGQCKPPAIWRGWSDRPPAELPYIIKGPGGVCGPCPHICRQCHCVTTITRITDADRVRTVWPAPEVPSPTLTPTARYHRHRLPLPSQWGLGPVSAQALLACQKKDLAELKTQLAELRGQHGITVSNWWRSYQRQWPSDHASFRTERYVPVIACAAQMPKVQSRWYDAHAAMQPAITRRCVDGVIRINIRGPNVALSFAPRLERIAKDVDDRGNLSKEARDLSRPGTHQYSSWQLKPCSRKADARPGGHTRPRGSVRGELGHADAAALLEELGVADMPAVKYPPGHQQRKSALTEIEVIEVYRQIPEDAVEPALAKLSATDRALIIKKFGQPMTVPALARFKGQSYAKTLPALYRAVLRLQEAARRPRLVAVNGELVSRASVCEAAA